MNLGLFILRIAVGVIMIAHGYNHIFRGGKIEGTAGWFASLGMRPGILHAWLASATELGAGALLILGFFNPLAAAGVVGTMAVALITNHLKNGFFIFRPGEGWEYVGLLVCTGLALGAMGAGEWSVDNALDWDWTTGITGFVITAVVGLGGAAALLAVFWRPQKKD
nr:DoxX family protein [Rhabdothermincola salaria]